MGTIIAKDLTKEFPRSPYEELEGFPWLPRMIDKTRSLLAGKLGEYFPFPCGGDRDFLASVGLDAAGFKAKVASGATDAEIAQWVKQNVKPDYEQGLAEYSKSLRAGYPSGSELAGNLKRYKAEFAKANPNADLSKVDNFWKLFCLEEGHTFPA